MLIRRVVPAIVATLAAYAGLAVVTGGFLREHYLTRWSPPTRTCPAPPGPSASGRPGMAGSGPSSGSRAAGCSRCQRCSSPQRSGWSAAAPP